MELAMFAIKRILCPIDFSEFSRQAFARAAALAKAHGASITALHVVRIPPRFAPFPLEVTVPAPLGLTPEQLESLRRELLVFVQPGTSTAVPIETVVVEAPMVHSEIVAQAARLGADVIVMGTHGRGGFERLLLGSVTEKVLRLARQPVMTVGSADSGGATGAFGRILCGIDFSECSLAAFKYALTLAEGAEAQLTAVNVIEWTPIGYDPLIGPPTDMVGYRMAAEADGRERLHQAVVHANTTKVGVDEVVTSGKPHRELLRIARDRGCDLIVLGIHGRNPIDRMFFGSTAEPVVRHAPCPVLTVRMAPPANIAAA
jgi:nucleotide-binding universal stress UspA family protein